MTTLSPNKSGSLPKLVKMAVSPTATAHVVDHYTAAPVVALEIFWEKKGENLLNPAKDEPKYMALCDGHNMHVLDLEKVAPSKTFNFLKEKPVIGFNLKKTLIYIYRSAGVLPRVVYDILAAEWLLSDCQADVDSLKLETVVKDRLGEEVKYLLNGDFVNTLPEKQMMDMASRLFKYFSISDTQTRLLNEMADNPLVCEKISGKISSAFGLRNPPAVLEFAFLPVVAGLEISGLPVKPKDLDDTTDNLASRVTDITNNLVSNHGVAPTLNRDIAAALIKAGFALPTSQKSGAPSVNEDALKEIDHPIARMVIEYRKLKKQHELLTSAQRRVTGTRVRATYNPYGLTGRVGASDPPLGSVPKGELRKLFEVAAPQTLVMTDFPQIEMRIKAVVSKDKVLLDAFEHNEDIHVKTAAAVANVLPENVTKESRHGAKAINYGLIFGMGAERLKEYGWKNFGVKMSIEQATQYKEAFCKLYSGVEKHRLAVSQALKDSGGELRLSTILGRRMLIKKYTDALDYPIQGTAADLLKLSCVYFRNNVASTKKPVKLCHLVHDEILAETSLFHANFVGELLAKAIVDAALTLGIPMKKEDIDVKIQRAWG